MNGTIGQLTIQGLWQQVFIAVAAKQGVSTDGALFAADEAVTQFKMRFEKKKNEEQK